MIDDRTAPGQAIKYKTSRGNRQGVYVRHLRKKIVEVKLDGDPFTVCVNSEQVTINKSPNETVEVYMPTGNLNAKELRKLARENNVDGWEDMGLAELRKAVAPFQGGAKPAAKKTAAKAAAPAVADDDDWGDDDDDTPVKKAAAKRAPAKKAPAKKAAAKAAKAPAKKTAAKKAAPAADDDAPPYENGNPFKKGTNLYEFAEELIKGGKRAAMVKRLKKKVDLKPRNASADYDEDAEIDRRILIVGQIMQRDHGFLVNRSGRGAAEAEIYAEVGN